jgi:hypothetical protein
MRDLRIVLAPLEVRRCLGYSGKRRPSRAVEERLSGLWDEAVGLLKPAGDYRTVTKEEALAAGMPSPAERVGVGLCTAGCGLEQEGLKRAGRGETLDALILDAVGSAAAEAAADALNALLCEEAGKAGLYVSPRVSPGYGRWDVACQPRLLALLPAKELGVTLTPGLMMVPRKSVSFAANLLKDRPRGYGNRSRCARCGLKNCPYSEAERG